MDKDILPILGGLISGLVGAYVMLRMLKPNIKAQEAKTEVDKTQATKNVVDAMQQAVEASSQVTSSFQAAFQFLENERKEERREMTDLLLKSSVHVNELEDRIKDIEKNREEREGRIVALENNQTSLENNQRTLLVQAQEWENRYNELREKSDKAIRELKEKYNKAIEILVNALDEEKRGSVMADLALLLGDSISKFKLPKAGK